MLTWASSPIRTSDITTTLPASVGKFAVDAVDGQSGKRRAPTGILRSEDAELPPERRRLLLSQTRDLHRNFAVAGWMVRQHLNYVANFTFEAMCTGADGQPDDVFNEQLELCMRNWSVASQCDVANRLSLMQMMRTLEARASLDGDCGFLKINTGRLQGLEGDRVRTPYGGVPAELKINPERLVHGIETDEANSALSYIVCRRTPASDFGGNFQNFLFERRIMARDMIWHGYYDRFDQVRGVPPITPAVNAMIDLYEGIDYALARLKVEQLLGLWITRANPNGGPNDDPTDYTQIRLGKQPFTAIGDPGDEAKFLSSSNPSTQFQSFIQWLVQICLKCFDIPFSFFSEAFTTYSGARQAWLQYDISCAPKRDALRGILNQITAWILEIWMQDGLLPRRPIESIKWDWVPAGMPWIDPLKEVQGNLAALSGALDCRTDISRAGGRNWRNIARKLAAENKFLASLGLPVAITPDAATIQALLTEPEPQEVTANAAV